MLDAEKILQGETDPVNQQIKRNKLILKGIIRVKVSGLKNEGYPREALRFKSGRDR